MSTPKTQREPSPVSAQFSPAKSRQGPNATRRDKKTLSDRVARAEAKDIWRRREEVDLEVDNKLKDKLKLPNDLVGLALSGGGVRSASFNLGVLQAMTKSGLIRWVDYMSTVSGGGFIGSYFSTLLCHRKLRKDLTLGRDESEVQAVQRGRASKRKSRSQIADDHRSGRKKLVTNDSFIHGGDYLRGPAEMADRFVIGFLFNALIWLSLLIFSTAFIAIVWRTLDWPFLTYWLREHLPSVGEYSRDWSRPFVIPLILFLLWFVTWPFTYLSRDFHDRFQSRRRWRSRLLMAGLFCLVPSVAVLLATDNIFLGNLPFVDQGGSASGSASNVNINSPKILGIALAAVIILNLLPYLNPYRLLRSDFRPPGKVERSILRQAGLVLLFFVPFSLVYLFAWEGLSWSLNKPDSRFAGHHIKRPFDLLAQWREEARSKGERTLGDVLYKQYVRELSLGSVKIHDNLQAAAEKYHATTELTPLLAAVESKDIDGLIRQWSEIGAERFYVRQAAKEGVRDSIAGMLNKTCQGTLLIHYVVDKYGYSASSHNRDEFLSWTATLHDAGAFDKLWPRAIRAQGDLTGQQSRQLSRIILEAHYPLIIVQRTQAGLESSWASDQNWRLVIIVSSACVFLVFGAVVNLNATSLHGFFRGRIERAFVVKKAGQQRKHVPLWKLRSAENGGPYHLFTATLNILNRLPWNLREFDSNYSFIFSRYFCGSEALVGDATELDASPDANDGYASTDAYCDEKLDVATAAAISGAALSPAIVRSPLVATMAFLLNLRLGQWLPNPRTCPLENNGKAKRRWFSWVSGPYFVNAIGILLDVVRVRKGQMKRGKYCFISDGGHNDNLGLGPLAIRGCKLIIISDASMDPDHEFIDFMRLFRRYRMRGNWQFCRLESPQDDTPGNYQPLTLERLKLRQLDTEEERDLGRRTVETPRRLIRRSLEKLAEQQSQSRCNDHFLVSKLVYTPKEEQGREEAAYIVYIKPTLTGDESVDLHQYARQNPAFPHDPTTDQFFTENQVKSYRQLGEHIGNQLAELVKQGLRSSRTSQKAGTEIDLWDEKLTVVDLIDGIKQGYFEHVMHADGVLQEWQQPDDSSPGQPR